MRIVSTALFVILMVCSATIAATEQGTGMLFGSDHAFYISAPDGWILDNRSGANQGLHMVFYPVGETWANSPVMAYGQSVPKSADIKSVADQVENTVKKFHTNGNPKYRAEQKPPLSLPDNKEAVIYYFQGDQWGNFEAAGYIEENKTINFLVFNARTKEVFDKNIPSFYKLLSSYRNSFTAAGTMSKPSFDEIVSKAKEQTYTQQGKAYKASVRNAIGQLMANSMRSCFDYVSEENKRDFQFIFKIASDGQISEVFVTPENSLTTCFSGLVLNAHCPPHKFGSFLLYERMDITK